MTITQTVRIPREYRICPTDATIVQTRGSEWSPWRPFVVALDAQDAFASCLALKCFESNRPHTETR